MAAIRPVQTDDFAQWSVLWDGYNAFYGRAGTNALNDEITRTTWRRFFDVYEPMQALVAEREKRLVGLTHFLYHRSTTSIAPVCYLQDLFVAETERGQGTGEALIKAVYAKALEAKASRVYWQTHETNLTAQRLYERIAEKSGFIVYRHML